MVNKPTVLHFCQLDKFIPPYIEFIRSNFDFERHIFLVMGDVKKFPIHLGKNIIHLKRTTQIFSVIRKMNSAEKIILHSIFSAKVVLLLAAQPWLLRKCYWVIWGGDLYDYQHRARNIGSNIYEAVRAFVIKRIGHFVTYFKGEYRLAERWYGAKGQHHECFTYPSNVFRGVNLITGREHETINIQLGNSATRTNQHFEMLEKLSNFRNHNIKIYAPLSYGDDVYARQVAEYGQAIFGDKFIPMFHFVPRDEYVKFLSQIDVAIFNNNRQQAIGNVITLLGLGKKVYLSPMVTSWTALQELGLHIFSVDDFDLSPLSTVQAEENARTILAYFSDANLIAQLSAIFGTQSHNLQDD